MYIDSLWAIRPEAVPAVLQMLERAARGEAIAQPERQRPAAPSGPNKVAVVSIYGVLSNSGPAWQGSNYQSIADAVEKAAAEPDVKRIILSVDSPGGEVTGLGEAAAVIAAATKVKPVSAIVEGMAASAAYWLTSQASDITLTPSGEVGSVGVRMMHVDMSKMLENEGYKVTEMSSGEFKTEWSPYKPLSEEAQADMQTRLDSNHRDFVSAIVSGRGGRASAAAVKSRFGGGRMFTGKDALAHGMVDKLQPAREFYRGLSAPSAPATPAGFSPRRARLMLERLKV